MTSQDPPNVPRQNLQQAAPDAPSILPIPGQRSPLLAAQVVMVGTFMAILDTFIVLVAAPAIQANLHASDAEIQFVLAGYQLTYAATLITGARLGDIYGRRRLFVTGMLIFTVASLACGAAPNPAALIVARLVQGVGSGMMFPQVFSMIGVLVPPEQRHRAFGILGAVIGTSTIVGQLIGGLLISANLFHTSWRPVFLVNIPICLVTVLLTMWLVPETAAPQAARLDLPGVVVLTVALTLLVFPITEGRQVGWALWIWLCLAGSAVAFAAFVITERRVAARGGAPLVAMRLFAQRPFTVGMGLVLVTYAGLYSFFLMLSLTLQDGLRLSALSAGLVYTPEAVTFFVVSLLAGKLAPRYGRRLLEVGAVIFALGYGATVLAAATSARLSVAVLIATLLVQGVGSGLLITPLFNAILSRMGPGDIGTASGVLSTTQQVGGSIGVAVIGVVFFAVLGPALPGRATAYGHALAVSVACIACFAVIGALLAFALPKAPA